MLHCITMWLNHTAVLLTWYPCTDFTEPFSGSFMRHNIGSEFRLDSDQTLYLYTWNALKIHNEWSRFKALHAPHYRPGESSTNVSATKCKNRLIIHHDVCLWLCNQCSMTKFLKNTPLEMINLMAFHQHTGCCPRPDHPLSLLQAQTDPHPPTRTSRMSAWHWNAKMRF